MHTAQSAAFWQRFLAHSGRDPHTVCTTVFHFDDHEASANQLADLVLAGIKRGTASLVWTLEAEAHPELTPGTLHIVTRFDGTPVAVIETTAVTVTPFAEVSAEFAAIEGEGDCSLVSWRSDHWEFFSRECARIGRTPSQDMPVLCECFTVVYRES